MYALQKGCFSCNEARLDRVANEQLEHECATKEANATVNRQPLVAVPVNNPITDANALGTSQAGALSSGALMTGAAADGGRDNNDNSPAHSKGGASMVHACSVEHPSIFGKKQQFQSVNIYRYSETCFVVNIVF